MPNLTPTRATPRQATSAAAYTADPPAPDDPLLSFAPVPHTAPRRNSITPDLQRAFIAHLATTGIVTAAARHIGKSVEALYKLRQRGGSDGFRAAWDAAIDRGVSRLEAGALARAIEGEQRMVVSAGKILGTEVRHNDALVMFFLRGRMRDRYGNGGLVPGHPDYEALKARLRAEWQAEEADRRASPESHEANLKFFHELKERWRREWEREQALNEAKARVLGDPPVDPDIA
ncbi:hypothetical protein FGU71_10820 [Erythrobacter insulae]|uniref:Uncharacterized protein n=1 Tax=Erythrobacter insulae TaxID=2584124 RepID=A0A547PDV2_9SPHN|nr:hypothetical protein [Erythrobacter insulae]TRD12306.1 hypothetical protein FGU71_10820 [Erythrobacter insulae]